MVGPTLGNGWNCWRADICPALVQHLCTVVGSTFAPKLRNNVGFRVVGPMMVQHMLAVWKSSLVNSPCVKVVYNESPKLGVQVTSFVVNTDENCLLKVSAFLQV